MTLSLSVQKRAAGTSADALRRDGKIPAVVYGPKHESEAIAIEARDFDTLFKEAGESTIVALAGLDTETEVLIHDVAFNPTRGGVMHVDFYAIERGKELTTNVPLTFTGEAPVEKGGATANKILYEVEVTCRPSDLPSEIEVDLSVLTDAESTVHVRDLSTPAGVKIENDPDDIVANVAAAREEEPEESAELDMDAIEVEQKGKDEDGDSTTKETG